MASKRDMEIGREFAGNGASSFDARDWRVGRADVAPLEPDMMAAIRAAEAQIARAFSPERPCQVAGQSSGQGGEGCGMTFQLDTTGRVLMAVSEAFEWSDLSPFTQGYIEALLADALPLYNVATSPKFTSLAPETLARIIADCGRVASSPGGPGTTNDGRRFWNMRQVGWEGFPPLTVQLGDDGKVRFAEPDRSSEGEGAQ